MYQILHVVLFVIDGFFGLEGGSRFILWIICRHRAGQDAGGVVHSGARCPAYRGWWYIAGQDAPPTGGGALRFNFRQPV